MHVVDYVRLYFNPIKTIHFHDFESLIYAVMTEDLIVELSDYCLRLTGLKVIVSHEPSSTLELLAIGLMAMIGITVVVTSKTWSSRITEGALVELLVQDGIHSWLCNRDTTSSLVFFNGKILGRQPC